MGVVSLHAGSPRLGLALGQWPGLLLYAGVLLAVVAARGFMLSRALGGRYPIADLLYDVVTFGTAIAGLRLFDRLVRRAVDRWMDDETRPRHLTARVLRAPVTMAVAFPFTLVTPQPHPVRIPLGGAPRPVARPIAATDPLIQGMTDRLVPRTRTGTVDTPGFGDRLARFVGS